MERYVPAESTAREALEAALKEWQAGKPIKPIKLGEVSVDAFDARWRSGKKLQSYTIMEELPANPHRSFKVKLHIDGLPKEEECTYLVIGINPLLVFREQDYLKAGGL